MGVIFLAMFLLQLKYTGHARKWTKNIGYFAAYVTTLAGLVGVLSTFTLKHKLDKIG